MILRGNEKDKKFFVESFCCAEYLMLTVAVRKLEENRRFIL